MAVSCTVPETAGTAARNSREISSFLLYTACPAAGSTDDSPSFAAEDTIESVLLLPKLDGPQLCPLIVCPHGGPHSAFTTANVPHYSEYLCRQAGMGILMVNYRGSTGYGSKALNALPGRIGRLDVDDVMAATRAALQLFPTLLDGNNVGVMGGSHGGFLAAHLIGQFPLFFRAAALRNPVTNIPAMFTTSDIPDWTVVEACGSGRYDFDSFTQPTADDMAKMREASPIRYVKDVVSPVLLCLGANDRRVPYSQGMEYYRALASHRSIRDSKQSEVILRVYPECDHAIDKPNGEADQFICIRNFFVRHMTKSNASA
ncbi:APEH [Symbiodinium microadriaticum]|nr:APEH [Symbiodinium microadriaticum]